MIHANWERWIVASIFKVLSEKTWTYPYVLQGMVEKLVTPRFEIRYNGPYYSIFSENDPVKLQVAIQILCVAALVPADMYQLQRMSGLAASHLDSVIQCYKYGDGNEFLVCLNRVDQGRFTVESSYLGLVDNRHQVAVNALYEGAISGTA